MNYCTIIDSPLGKLGIKTSNNSLEKIDFLPASSSVVTPCNELAAEVVFQLNEYFHHSNYRFTLPLTIQGTAFQQQVWNALLKIPNGETFSYGSLAKALNTGPRAIGNACRTNRIPIIIPCHRIVGQNNIGGYSGFVEGETLAIKHWLLNHEKNSVA